MPKRRCRCCPQPGRRSTTEHNRVVLSVIAPAWNLGRNRFCAVSVCNKHPTTPSQFAQHSSESSSGQELPSACGVANGRHGL